LRRGESEQRQGPEGCGGHKVWDQPPPDMLVREPHAAARPSHRSTNADASTATTEDARTGMWSARACRCHVNTINRTIVAILTSGRGYSPHAPGGSWTKGHWIPWSSSTPPLNPPLQDWGWVSALVQTKGALPFPTLTPPPPLGGVVGASFPPPAAAAAGVRSKRTR
jgi:hypothetical protein